MLIVIINVDKRVMLKTVSFTHFYNHLVPSKPEKFKVSIKDRTSVRLSWTRPFKTKGAIQSYKVEYQMIGDEKLQEVSAQS